MTNRTPPRRFNAKLLFQFRVVVDGRSNTMRKCEERMIIINAPTARMALVKAKQHGKASEHSYKNGAGSPVHFEFVGVQDLVELGVECEENEVWYNITVMKRPKERAKAILPAERKLNALYWEER